MNTKDLQGKLVAVLGYGMEGKAVANYLLKHGIKPALFDQKPWNEWGADEQETIKNLGINFIFGPDCFKELRGFDVAFRSPGIKLSEVASYGLRVTSQTKFFFEHCPAKMIGVTGTKGKGTTSALIYEMLRANSYKLNAKSYLTGNIGKVQPLELLDNLKAEDWIVYELSSFQLQDLTKSPHIAVVLMTTSEHLDYHRDGKEYVDAKSAVTKFQTADDIAVVSADFKNSLEIGELGKSKKLYFSRQKTGLDCFIKDDDIVINNSNFRFPIANLQLKGAHNLENVCAAVLAAKSAGCDDAAIKSALAHFKGLEHRLEFASEKYGIKFYNDSFSTTPETAIAAINAFDEPLIVILGGSSKNSDFSQLAKTIIAAKNIKALILIGREAEKINDSINKAGQFNGEILTSAKDMPAIFNQIKSVAKKGDVVLLSPACASFDMFKNYQDRGEQFKNQVKKW